VCFSAIFPSGAKFPGEEFAPAWLKLPLEHLKICEKKCSPGNPALKVLYTQKRSLITAGAPENLHALREILLLEEILG
jgi:hypothetical protein